MNLDKALEIEGGMNPMELAWLADKASKSRWVVEIGSLRGRSARAMADNMSNLSVLFCVDPFQGSEEHGGAFAGTDNLYRTFCANLADHIERQRVCPVHLPSLEAARIFRLLGRHDLDMVFIDASHDYASVTADIRAWLPLLKPGGLLSGHDHGHPPIERAVRDLLGPGLPGLVPGGSIWFQVVE
jgi:predicted O-methyltransferase YrrM